MAALNSCAPGVAKDKSGSCIPKSARVPGCSTDLCSAKARRDAALLSRLRPEMPAGWKALPRALLDTNNIDAVMFQYERHYPQFKYLRTLPIDAFSREAEGGCSVSRLCDVDVCALRADAKKLIGAVMNLDRHDQPGSHWVSFALDLRRKPVIWYYDSFARRPPAPLLAFFKRLVDEVPSTAASRRHMLKNSAYNARAHQRQNTECGIFATLALEGLLEGVPFASYCGRAIDDDFAFAQRERLFSRE